MIQLGLRVVLALSILQSTELPARIGEPARKLSRQDIADLERAIATAGGRSGIPWFVLGGEFPEGNSVVHAYLAQERVTDNFRRNTKVVLTRQSSRDPWAVHLTEESGQGPYYVQVAIPGRSFDSIVGDRDNNQPFEVYGSFSDTELIAMVTLIRSNPLSASAGSWPIKQINRAPDGSVNVALTVSGGSGISAVLRGSGDTWRIIRTFHWVY